jgi:archaellum component FlaC
VDESSLATGAICGLALCLVEVVKRLTASKEDKAADYRLQAIEEDLGEVKEMLGAIKTAFYEFREEVRIERVKQRGE